MKSGFDTMRAIFDAVSLDNLTTRREIADKLELSIVSVSKAVQELTAARILTTNGSVSTGGRRSESLSPNYSVKYPIVNLCDKPFSFAFASLGERLSAHGGTASSVNYVSYARDLDFAENVARLITRLREYDDSITEAAVAIPNPSEQPSDYLGDDLSSIFERRGITPVIFTTRSGAVAASPSVAPSPTLYISITGGVRGIYFGRSVIDFNWDSVRIDTLPFSELMKCAQKPETIAHHTERLVEIAKQFFCAESVLLDSLDLPAEAVDILLDRLPYLKDITFEPPVLEGLLHLLAEHKIKALPSSHTRSGAR